MYGEVAARRWLLMVNAFFLQPSLTKLSMAVVFLPIKGRLPASFQNIAFVISKTEKSKYLLTETMSKNTFAIREPLKNYLADFFR